MSNTRLFFGFDNILLDSFHCYFSFLRETEANKTKHARQMAEKKREAESSVSGVFYCCVIVQ